MDWAKIFRPDGALLRVKKSAFIRVYLRLKLLRLRVLAVKNRVHPWLVCLAVSFPPQLHLRPRGRAMK